MEEPDRDVAMSIDAVDLEVMKASLSGIVQEMQNSLFRTGFSTIVRESQDASCALMNANGEVVAQHVVLPLHIGAFPACTAAVIDVFGDGIAEGDGFIINHPYHGGSPHAPDIAVITPVFVDGELFGFCGSIAHKSDIGGPVPGSCSGQAREIFNEGLHVPAVRYQRGYRVNGDIERLIGANSRTPELVLGDIRGQLGADRLGEKRLSEFVANSANRKFSPASIVCSRCRNERSELPLPNGRTAASRRSGSSTMTASTWKRRCASTLSSTRRAIGSISISAARRTKPKGPPISARPWCRPPAPTA